MPFGNKMGSAAVPATAPKKKIKPVVNFITVIVRYARFITVTKRLKNGPVDRDPSGTNEHRLFPPVAVCIKTVATLKYCPCTLPVLGLSPAGGYTLGYYTP